MSSRSFQSIIDSIPMSEAHKRSMIKQAPGVKSYNNTRFDKLMNIPKSIHELESDLVVLYNKQQEIIQMGRNTAEAQKKSTNTSFKIKCVYAMNKIDEKLKDINDEIFKLEMKIRGKKLGGKRRTRKRRTRKRRTRKRRTLRTLRTRK